MFRNTPLNALRALESCARYCSLTRAGEELGVTPSAIRYQIRQLEYLVGKPLFRRNGPKLEVLPIVTAIMDQMQTSLKGLNDVHKALQTPQFNTLNICVDISFSILWLTPNLPDFKKSYPELDVNLLSPIGGIRQTIDDIDIEISAHFTPENSTAYILTDEIFTPLCSPSYLTNHAKLGDIENGRLLDIEPLNDNDPYPNWDQWGTQFKLDKNLQRNSYSLAVLAIQAAVNGEGVVLASELLTRDLIALKSLICPSEMFEKSLRCNRYAKIRNPNNQNAQLFLSWLSAKLESERN